MAVADGLAQPVAGIPPKLARCMIAVVLERLRFPQ
jgi:hypothetical protein